jgi:hypothetical protein
MLRNTQSTIQHQIPQHLNPEEGTVTLPSQGSNEELLLLQSMTQQFITLNLPALAEDRGCYACDIYGTELVAKTEHTWVTARTTI